jgi:hypothetical protein
MYEYLRFKIKSQKNIGGMGITSDYPIMRYIVNIEKSDDLSME